jgi:hypothetical protein
MPWKLWRQMHPGTLVLAPPAQWQRGLPNGPVEPSFPIPGDPHPSSERVALIQGPSTAIVDEANVGPGALNLLVGATPMLMYRGQDGSIRAFLREVDGDLTPRFYPWHDPRHGDVAFTEPDTASLWSGDGLALSGTRQGEKMLPFQVEDDVYADVLRFWIPDAQMITPSPDDIGQPPAPKAMLVRNVRRAARSRRTRLRAS